MTPIDPEYLARRVDDIGNELRPLRPIPYQVASHDRRLEKIDARLDRAEDAEVRRVTALRADYRRLEEKLDRIATATKTAARNGAIDGGKINALKVFIAVATAIGTPIALALIATGGGS